MFVFLMTVSCIFILFFFKLQPTNGQIYIAIFSLNIMVTPTCFDTSVSSSGSFKNLYFAELRKFLKLKQSKINNFNLIILWNFNFNRLIVRTL